jgi:hypothetical protein
VADVCVRHMPYRQGMGVMLIAKMLPIGPGGPQADFSALRYVSRDFRKTKLGPRTPRPPRPPVPPRSWCLVQAPRWGAPRAGGAVWGLGVSKRQDLDCC